MRDGRNKSLIGFSYKYALKSFKCCLAMNNQPLFILLLFPLAVGVMYIYTTLVSLNRTNWIRQREAAKSKHKEENKS